MELTRDGKEGVWAPGCVSIRGNFAADFAAKDALSGNISDELILFSDLKPCVNKYFFELWRLKWDEYSHNKLHKIFPVLGISCPCSNMREETVICHLHAGHSYLTHSLVLEGEEPLYTSHVISCLA